MKNDGHCQSLQKLNFKAKSYVNFYFQNSNKDILIANILITLNTIQ